VTAYRALEKVQEGKPRTMIGGFTPGMLSMWLAGPDSGWKSSDWITTPRKPRPGIGHSS
jgi:hypothetical protein